MLTMPRIDWVAPRRLEEALDLLDKGSRGRIEDEGDVAARRGPVLRCALQHVDSASMESQYAILCREPRLHAELCSATIFQ